MEEGKTLIEINVDYIRYNYLLLRKITKQNELCIPVVKADAYGFNHFDVVDNFLNMENPQKDFFVYFLEEGYELRKEFGDKIRDLYCITGPILGQEEIYLKYNIIPVINSIEQLKIWSNFAKNKNLKLKCLIQFNLGLNRSGIQQGEINFVKNFVNNDKNNLELVMIMGHLACQYPLNTELGQKFTKKEFELFENAYKNFPNVKRSLIATEGILKIQNGFFESTRPGTILYTGQLDNVDNYIFKTAITITSPIFVDKNTKNMIYINFGLKHGLALTYQNKGYILVDGEKIYATKVEHGRTIFETDDNTKYENKIALLVGYYKNDYIDGYKFSHLNSSVPEEILCRMTYSFQKYPNEIKQVVINGYKYKKEIEPCKNLEARNYVEMTEDNHIIKLTSTITEIRKIEENGGCGYDATELVKTGDIIGTFPLGYADGFYRKISNNNLTIFIEIDNKLVELPLCGKVPMDQMCFRIPQKYENKVKIGDKIIIIDENKNITVKRFEDCLNLKETEIFFMVNFSKRIKRVKVKNKLDSVYDNH